MPRTNPEPGMTDDEGELLLELADAVRAFFGLSHETADGFGIIDPRGTQQLYDRIGELGRKAMQGSAGRRAMTTAKPKPCPACDGEGRRFMAPQNVIPFNVPPPQFAHMLEDRTCLHGLGSGETPMTRPKLDRIKMTMHWTDPDTGKQRRRIQYVLFQPDGSLSYAATGAPPTQKCEDLTAIIEPRIHV